MTAVIPPTLGTRLLRRTGIAIAILLAVVIAALLISFMLMRASLPQLDGKLTLADISAPTSIGRDASGTAVIKAENALDAVRALGFVHAQERFFEMDLTRRSAAGELSALLGSATLNADKKKRVHRLRTRAVLALEGAHETERSWLAAYTEGVNAGLTSLAVRPWQYLILRVAPEAWRAEDSLLVIAEMYFMLQSGGIDSRYADIRLRQGLGDTLFEWMRPNGGTWDATLDGVVPASPVMPSTSVINTRTTSKPTTVAWQAAENFTSELLPGSNNWAVGRSRTADGRAILACDMHLGLTTPGIWYRAQLNVVHEGKSWRIAGLTLPGVPQMVAGSNGEIAWGYTNSYGQWFDWVGIPKQAPKASEVRRVTEHIKVKGADTVTIEVRETDWGPVVREDEAQHYVLSWVLHHPGALINHIKLMMFSTSVEDALETAKQTPIPHQNLLVADRRGDIAWTIIGRIPLRNEWNPKRGTTLQPNAVSANSAWLETAKYPVLKNPASGQLWTANSLQLGGKGSEYIGDGGFDLGARATQIRDRLSETAIHSEASLYALQLDAESRLFKRWADLAITQSKEAGASDKVKALATALRSWNGRADIDQTGHLIARSFRDNTMRALWQSWIAARAPQLAKFDLPESSDAALSHDSRFEYAAWTALTERPIHLLPTKFANWSAFIDSQLEQVHESLVSRYGSIEKATWGARNMSLVRHPFSRVMPFLSPYLDMPRAPQAGDNHLPRVASPSFGASQRMVVSPGREEDAILTVAGGQSGHPLSPFYGAGHSEWQEAKSQPLLAGETKHKLTLQPAINKK
jgi:penicillin G amidase